MKLPPLTLRTLGRVAAGIFLARSSAPSECSECEELREQNLKLSQIILDLTNRLNQKDNA